MAPAASAPQEILDVWSRTAPKYRRRAVLMLVLLAIMFAGLCSFTFWLRTGVYLAWDYPAYAELMYRSFNPSGPNQVTLSQFLSSPIDVQRVPIHGVIVGLLFASICSVPILVAILYRLPFAIIFAGMVIFLAAMPWLGLTVMAGCTLATLPRFRFSFRFASALFGLVPIGIYFISASWEPTEAVGQPIQNRAMMYAPWVLAVLSSCVICAVALALAKLINFRPGGVAPILAFVFAIPLYLFHTQVGRDELEYRVLEKRIGPHSSEWFAPVDLAAVAYREATRVWSRTPDVSYDTLSNDLLRRLKFQALLNVENNRMEAVELCDGFMEHFPASRYVPSVLFLKAMVQDLRPSSAGLEREHRLEFRDDLPSRGSRTTWKTIAERFPDDPICAMARYRLAILDGRDGKPDAAVAHLDDLLRRFESPGAASRPASAGTGRLSVFQRADPSAGLGLNLRVVTSQTRRLREMLGACASDAPRRYADVFVIPSADPEEHVHPIRLLLSLDDADLNYRANLNALAAAFPRSNTADYARLRLHLLEPAVSRRIQRLREAATDLAGRPAGAEARFHLGTVLLEDSLVGEARAVLTELAAQYPDSCWAQAARDRLSSLSIMERPTTGP